MTALPHFIRAWRKHRGLTQASLAGRLGIDRSHLSNIETGRRRYDQRFLEAAAVALGCAPADLISRDPHDVDELQDVIAALSAAQRTQALAVLKALMA